jgi:TRAP-type mannitol/chloroaromatic compound transport system permease small subunit
MGVDASKLSEVLPHRERLPHTQLSKRVRAAFNALTGWISWLWLMLIAVVVFNVTMRYLFGQGRVEFEEIQWHLYAVGFLVAMATCMDADDHVRVDVFHDRMSLRMQAWIELYGLLLLFLPFVTALIVFSLPFVSYSWQIGEVSDAPGGLPYRWLIKGALPLAMLLLLAAGISRLSRVTAYLFSWPTRVR